ncbi:hypothetical protein [Streptomyces sp. NPDC001054]
MRARIVWGLTLPLVVAAVALDLVGLGDWAVVLVLLAACVSVIDIAVPELAEEDR